MTETIVSPDQACNCEHIDHETGDGHAPMAVPAGARKAAHVGAVCDECADGHLADYVVDDEDDEQHRAPSGAGTGADLDAWWVAAGKDARDQLQQRIQQGELTDAERMSLSLLISDIGVMFAQPDDGPSFDAARWQMTVQGYRRFASTVVSAEDNTPGGKS